MKAAILSRPKHLEISHTPDPPCPAGGVVITVKACGICSADAKMIARGHPALVYPRIPGHEFAGIVAESRTEAFKPGDRVQVAPGLRCGSCRPCRNGSDNLCENREIYGFTRDGGFARYVSVPLEGLLLGALHPLPENVGFAEATLAEPIACCINAQDRANIQKGDTVLIIGAGPLGLLHAVVAGLNGVEKILVAEPLPHRREICTGMSGACTIDPARQDLFAAVMDETDASGVDAVVLACSQLGLNDDLLKLLRPGGAISAFSGMPSGNAQARFDSNRIHYNEIRITGAYGCTAAQNKKAVRMLAAGQVPVDALISGRVALDDLGKGIERTASRKAIKFIVEV